uniref:Uncharacterized protein n=1 Tax=Polytomella parva TaxID=51329 RepID=A0A7S0UQC9_9CHLO|mmetsp:Transcript_17172/g.31305  ORF Transcript_17172/g.31305 Transcript_17172/m.31305 type:complete len:443 (+) Transcript_17172:334-1662(+)|eukprot:CAMPEP_0175069870 /NCGR_PEP_ID=MMETSP0052_2-20121109/18419_1 /TAXON_ID=51329 ORGANISM="Polytomella parva, Strain SAG 63-3" /NCGR_SAMPLE_ID=MMETSP0052_2 /ASSEMBLY_ACC=CAM_ASM_000194 /LENGTH=442 /DNA_ID=CAMNT_0016336961 /DNA_START=220 /DNA_END=1548 /DNA_ORIENTATION=-
MADSLYLADCIPNVRKESEEYMVLDASNNLYNLDAQHNAIIPSLDRSFAQLEPTAALANRNPLENCPLLENDCYIARRLQFSSVNILVNLNPVIGSSSNSNVEKEKEKAIEEGYLRDYSQSRLHNIKLSPVLVDVKSLFLLKKNVNTIQEGNESSSKNAKLSSGFSHWKSSFAINNSFSMSSLGDTISFSSSNEPILDSNRLNEADNEINQIIIKHSGEPIFSSCNDAEDMQGAQCSSTTSFPYGNMNFIDAKTVGVTAPFSGKATAQRKSERVRSPKSEIDTNISLSSVKTPKPRGKKKGISSKVSGKSPFQNLKSGHCHMKVVSSKLNAKKRANDNGSKSRVVKNGVLPLKGDLVGSRSKKVDASRDPNVGDPGAFIQNQWWKLGPKICVKADINEGSTSELLNRKAQRREGRCDGGIYRPRWLACMPLEPVPSTDKKNV